MFAPPCNIVYLFTFTGKMLQIHKHAVVVEYLTSNADISLPIDYIYLFDVTEFILLALGL